MIVVIDYYDMRPVDWVSGKRLALSPGEGHICDRCEAEHAVVYVVQDTDTGKEYRVGSSCAKAQFGFEADKSEEAKKLVRTYKQKAAAELDETRQKMVAVAAEVVSAEVSQLPVPEPLADTVSYPGVVCWRVGDSLALVRGRSDEETKLVALRGWIEHRVAERVPPEWNKVEILTHPDTRSRDKTTMGSKLSRMVTWKLSRWK